MKSNINLINKQYSFGSLNYWKSYIIHMRPYLFFVSGIAGLSGIALANPSDFPVWKSLCLYIPFYLGYGFGQALTDCFQTDTDKISAPYRPLSKGLISVQSVFWTSLTGLLVIGIILLSFHYKSFILSLIAVFGLATYTYVKKNISLGGPFYNAWIMAILPLMGYYAAIEYDDAINLKNILIPVTITFFTYANFVLIGYLKDMEADSATGYKTFPVIYGWKKTVLLGDVFGVIAMIIFWTSGITATASIIFGLAGSLVLVYGQMKAHFSLNKDEKDAMIPIIATVRTLILILSAYILNLEPDWVKQMILLYIIFEVTLYFRPSKYQI
jgi:4-hydroxybenzoate polyprenyltransferase